MRQHIKLLVLFTFCTFFGTICLGTSPSTAETLPIATVTASYESTDYPVSNTIDNDILTYWQSSGDQWIQYDLGSEAIISQVAIAFRKGDTVPTFIHIELSNDQLSWTNVFSGQSSVGSIEKENFTITETSARYVRIVCHGNTANSFNYISEVSVDGPSQAGNELPSHEDIIIISPVNFSLKQPSPPPTDTSQTTNTIEQHGITWTFSALVKYGQFVNGDYWVVDPGDGVKIVNITPGDAIREGTTQHMNGSMLNPHTSAQGYDGQREYDTTKNVGIDVSPSTPLILTGNVSLVSTISNLLPGVDHLSYVKTASVLTCLSSVPASGSFRPGISATSKTIHNISSIDTTFHLLKNLPYPTTKPNIETYANYFQMVFLDHGGWTTRFMRPSDSGMDNYYYAINFAEAGLMLQLDYTHEEKEKLLINSIQLGIDLYSFVETGRGWYPDGGNMNGRKWPIMFAGIMLDYAPMRDIGQKSGNYLFSDGYGPGNAPPDYVHFSEDGQVFYVTQDDVDITNSVAWSPDVRSAPNYPYTTAMIGMPEWAIRHSTIPKVSDSSWGSNYRTIGTGARAWAGVSMAVRIMGYKSQWNNPAFFDYMDRYMAIAKGEPDPFGYTVDRAAAGYLPSGLILSMWNTYRGSY